MTYDPERHRRRSIRLKGYDYAQPGAYFVTIVTQGRVCPFGNVVNGEMRLNGFGRIVEWTWHDLPNHVAGIVPDAFVVMPNHVHGVVVLTDTVVVVRAGSGLVGASSGLVGAGSEPAPTRRHSLPEIIRQFKTFSARRINQYRQVQGVPVWQRNYYEHLVRDDEAMDRIREYIVNNPLQWEMDRENPNRLAAGRLPLAKGEPWHI